MVAKGIIIDPKQFKIDMSYMTNEQMCKLYQMSNKQFKATCETLKIPPRAASNRVTLANNVQSAASASPLHVEYLKGLEARRKEFAENGYVSSTANKTKTVIPSRIVNKRTQRTTDFRVDADESSHDEEVDDTPQPIAPPKVATRGRKKAVAGTTSEDK